MGLNFSSGVTEQVSTTVNTITNDYLNEFISEKKSTATGTNLVDIKVGGDVNCNFKIEQDGRVAAEVLSEITSRQENELSTKISEALEQDVKKILEQQNDGLNLAQFNIGSDVNTFKSFTTNVINTTVQNTFRDTVETDAENKNIVRINVEGDFTCLGELIIDQTSTVALVSSNIVDNVVRNIGKTEVAKEMAGKYEATTTQRNIGLGGIDLGILIAGIVLCATVAAVAKSQSKKGEFTGLGGKPCKADNMWGGFIAIGASICFLASGGILLGESTVDDQQDLDTNVWTIAMVVLGIGVIMGIMSFAFGRGKFTTFARAGMSVCAIAGSVMMMIAYPFGTGIRKYGAEEAVPTFLLLVLGLIGGVLTFVFFKMEEKQKLGCGEKVPGIKKKIDAKVNQPNLLKTEEAKVGKPRKRSNTVP